MNRSPFPFREHAFALAYAMAAAHGWAFPWSRARRYEAELEQYIATKTSPSRKARHADARASLRS